MHKYSKKLTDKETIDRIINLYKATIKGYNTQWNKNNPEKGYNVMIKSSIDQNIMDSTRSMAESMM